MIDPIFALLIMGITALAALGIVYRNSVNGLKAALAFVIVAVTSYIAWVVTKDSLLGPAMAVVAATWTWYLSLPRVNMPLKIFFFLVQLLLIPAGDTAGLGVGGGMMLLLLILLDLFMSAFWAFAEKARS